MGSKKLKGLVVTGDGEVEIPDKDRFKAVKKNITGKLNTELKKWADRWRRYETCADLEITNELGIIPTRNWQTGQFEGWRGVDKSTAPMGWPEKNRTCAPYCPTAGCRDVEVKDGTYKGEFEYFPVKVIVDVTVNKHQITEIKILYHFNGMGQKAEVIVEDPITVEKQVYDSETGTWVDHLTGSVKKADPLRFRIVVTYNGYYDIDIMKSMIIEDILPDCCIKYANNEDFTYPDEALFEHPEITVSQELDYVRTILLHEPRGHRDMCGALFTPPVSRGAHFGLLFFDVSGYLDMCGHSTIGAATAVLEQGMFAKEKPNTHLSIDTPAGVVNARVRIEDGQVRSVTIRNVASFLFADERELKDK